ncbi:glycosyltransferase family 2 protein [Brachybacterium sp. Z12]|nr:glycosyltransferase family 2 protein [Brachybacterium sp. Z12]
MKLHDLREQASPKVSVVIGFKDWGIERLELSIRSIHLSLGDVPHEVIVSDYNSSDRASVADTARRVNAHHEIVETDGEWSRSRALNAGVRASRGEYILATDADMVFSPGALRRVVDQLDQHPMEIVILQCRDLPTGYSHEVISREGFDWDKFSAIAQIRPRWGMGAGRGPAQRLESSSRLGRAHAHVRWRRYRFRQACADVRGAHRLARRARRCHVPRMASVFWCERVQITESRGCNHRESSHPHGGQDIRSKSGRGEVSPHRLATSRIDSLRRQ